MTGTLTTRDAQVFPVSGVVDGNSGTLNFGVVAPPPQNGFCGGISFKISNVQQGILSGYLIGYCCGTVSAACQFNRAA